MSDWHSRESEIIGVSAQGRPLTVVYLGRANSVLRIFVVAGQHGDEKYARKAVNRLIANLGENLPQDFPSIQAAILLNANPDGASTKTRTNAKGIDLNRDHQRLESTEVYAIHSFVRSWQPHIVVDVHNYPPKRKHLLAKNLIFHHDIFVDVPTNLAVHCLLTHREKTAFLNNIQAALHSRHFLCERYSIVKPTGRVRHSTPDVVDARNGLSLRYNTFTILVEGRNPTREDGEAGPERTVAAQYHALCAIFRWAQQHQGLFVERLPHLPVEQERIPVRSQYQRPDGPLRLTFQNRQTQRTEALSFAEYTPTLEITRSVALPRAYAVPPGKAKVIETLQRHGFSSHMSNPAKRERVEYYLIQSVKRSCWNNRSPRKIAVLVQTEHRTLENYLIFPTGQAGGHALAVFLEPESKYGLQRYDDLDLAMQASLPYPVLRLVSEEP